MRKHLFVLLFFIICSCKKEDIEIDISSKANVLKVIEAERGIQQLDAVSFCVVKGNEILWSDAIGNATRSGTATANTRFFIASISKTVTAVAIMQLAESNRLDLDADINIYLPFQIRNPHHPNVPITTRMLLNHSSSISDAFYYTFDFTCWNQDCTIPLGQYLQDFFDVNGQFYSNKNFHKYLPSSQSNYSNLGFALLGYIVERIANQPFDDYCEQNIFLPLGMQKTEWRLKNVPLSELAVPFSPTITPNEPYYTLPDYPAGGVITTPDDFSIFLRMFIKKGTFNGAQILRPQTIALMQQKTLSLVRGGLKFDMGLGMYYHQYKGKELYGHGGGDQGITTNMAYDIENEVGVLVFNNSTLKNLDLIVYSLYQFGTKQ
ncbi:MAG: serine hydrolase domain-containing protein [Bacteroidia bacterium]|nr:serine hydrolase domain-containing protein [Bacteroidia bacterium]